MTQPSIEQIQNLMQQHRFEEAGNLLRQLLCDKEFIQEQAGGAYLKLFSAYITVLTQAKQDYHNALDAGIVLLREANKREREMKEGIDLARVTNEIAALMKTKKGLQQA